MYRFTRDSFTPSNDIPLKTRGFGLVEAVVVTSLISVAFAATLSAAVVFLRGGLHATNKTQALYLIEEGVEAMRFMRDSGYATHIVPLTGSGTFDLAPTTGGWSTVATGTPIFDRFFRTIALEHVHRRNADSIIVPASSPDPNTLDPGTAHLSVTVTWMGHSETFTTYIADLYDN